MFFQDVLDITQVITQLLNYLIPTFWTISLIENAPLALLMVKVNPGLQLPGRLPGLGLRQASCRLPGISAMMAGSGSRRPDPRCVHLLSQLAPGGGAAVSIRSRSSDVSLRYRLDRANVGTIKEAAVRTLRRQRKVEWFHALDGVSFEVARGEIFGVVGPNGAGKSTLMKIIARVLPPTTGRVIVRGQVAPMIELGSGMNPELTARENIILYGADAGP